MVPNCKLAERSRVKVVVSVHLSNYSSIVYELYISCHMACLHHIVANHPKLLVVDLPQSVHNLEEL